MTAALTAHGLSKRYGTVWALRDCELSLPAGRVIGLVGPNGAGKTTLLHLALGLLEQPTAGEIHVLGYAPRDQVGRSSHAWGSWRSSARSTDSSRWNSTCTWEPT